jgi:hypothetical protein
MKFSEHQDGLYYYETSVQPLVDTGVRSFVNTVTDNKALFVSREIDAADKARELYRKLGRPSQQQLEDILSKNVILNCPVTVDNAKRAMLIYGPDLATVRPPRESLPHMWHHSRPLPYLHPYSNITRT